jgi:HEAT repeat protein
VQLLHDPDPAVRAAAAGTLLACRADAEESVAVLIDAAAAEPDVPVRIAYVDVVGELARRGAGGPGAVRWLGGNLDAHDGDRPVRIAALSQLACMGEAMSKAFLQMHL